MAAYPWVLIFTDSTIATGDPGVTGLTPTFRTYRRLSDGVEITQPGITELGFGAYTFSADPANAEVYFDVDGGASLLIPKDRYLKGVMSYGDRLQPQDHTSIVADAQSALTAQGYTTARSPKLDNVDVAVSTRATPSQVVTSVQTALTAQGYTTGRAVNIDNLDIAVSSRVATTAVAGLVQSALTAQGYTVGRSSKLDNVDVAVSSRVSPSALPPNFSLLAITGAGEVTAFNVASAPTLSQIVNGVWNEAIAGHTTSGTFGLTVGTGFTGPTLSQIVAGVWNEVVAGHSTAGSFAVYLSQILGYGAPPSAGTVAAAVAAAVPTLSQIINGIWDTTTSGHTVSGSFALLIENIATLATTAATQSTTAAGYGAPPSSGAIAAACAGAILAGPNKLATDGSGGVTLASGGQSALVTAIAAAVPTVAQIWDALISGHTVSGSFAAELASILSVATSAAGSASTAAGFGAAPTVSAIAAAILRNTSNLLTTDGSGNVALSSAYQGTLLSAIVAALPSVSTIWNELISGHTVSGSFAAELASILSHATAADTQSSTAATQATAAAGSASTAAGYGKAPTIAQIVAALPTLAQIVAALPSLAQLLATPGTPLANDSTGALPANNLVSGLLDLPNGVAAGVTLRQALKAMGSVLAGVLSGAGTGTLDFSLIGNPSTPGVTVLVDNAGDRSSVTLPT